jgi:dihydroorotate dehydrogenase
VDFYKTVLQPLLFSSLDVDPEWLHQRTIQTLAWLGDRRQPLNSLFRQQLRQQFQHQDPRLEQNLWGLHFPNPLGLAAGFDKDGVAAAIWPDLGFGFAEVGTVTLQAQPGNPQPRLFRLPEDRAALNRMGFNNQGAAALVATLNRCFGPESRHVTPLGINLGKSKVTLLEQAAEDYLGSFRLLKTLGDYFVVNVSSPNTPGLRNLQAASELDPILTVLQAENQTQKPLLVKIAPDLDWPSLDAVLELAQRHRLAGIIATNTTIGRVGLKTQTLRRTGTAVAQEAGGISGAPLRQRSTEVIRYIWQRTEGTLPIIGVGGIFTAEDAWEKITAGASLVQVYTGWIYEGPSLVPSVLQGLSEKLTQLGLPNLGAAVGLQGV